MRPELVSDAVERSRLKVYFWLAETLEAAIGLEQVWLEFSSEIYHVGTEAVQFVLFPGDRLGKDLLRLPYNCREQHFPFCRVFSVLKLFEDVGDE